jgi:hypothetical protein
MSYTVAARNDPAVDEIADDRDRRAVIALRDLLQTHISEYRAK